jgi:hypothetical protein
MYLRKLSCASALACLLSASGCGQSPPAAAKHSKNAPGPAAVIAEFLEAVRTGDDQKAAGLLTRRARERTTELELVVAPPGSETAWFRVGRTSILEKDARVECEWTDLDTDGLLHTDVIEWLLRRDADGWRVRGMSHQTFSDREPTVLDFEQPGDMLRRQQLAEEELARREQALERERGTATIQPRR